MDHLAAGAVADHGSALLRALEHSDSAALLSDADGRVLHINAGAVRMLGFEPAEMIGRTPLGRISGRHTDTEQLARVHARIRPTDGSRAQAVKGELLVYTKAGRPLWVSAVVNPVFDAGGALLNFISVLTDITQTKMHEQLQHRVLEAIVREVPMAEVLALLCSEVERIAPEVVCSVLGIDSHGCLRPLAAPSLPAHVAVGIDGLRIGPQVGSCGAAAWRGEPVLVLDIATDPRWEDHKHLVLPLGLRACWSSPILAGDGSVAATFAFYYREPAMPSALHERLVAVSSHLCALLLERERSRERIHQLAHFDELSGLPSRALVSARAERLLHEAGRSKLPLSVLFIDLDRFKQVNETHGHSIGDQLLRETARRLQAQVRETDVIGRLAGDEFVAVLPDCGAQQTAQFAERLVAALAWPVTIDGLTLHLGASVGVAVFPDDGTDVDTLLRHADMAMFQAKGDTPGSFRFFRAEMNDAVRERAMLEADLRHALRQGGLELHYQPQVASADTTRLRGVEALLRWRHPTLGNVPPMRFVTLAEKCGLIRELGHWVLAEACRQMADWHRRGVYVPRVAVNMSPSNFKDKGLPELVAATLATHRLKASALVLEITESVMLESDEIVLATLDAVGAQGVRLSMDDFGTGYSSLGHLHRLPIGELKLDQSFVRDLENSASARALTSSVLRIADSLHMEVVAEGVETEAQYRFLTERGCDVLQGYYFARPMSAGQLEDWVAKQCDAPLAVAVVGL
ncbi:EAL domain-containing protein [soil metagenome]